MRGFETADAAIAGVAADVLEKGRKRSPRGMPTQELTMYAFELADPLNRITTNPERGASRGYMAAKLVWDVAQADSVADLEWWNPMASKFSDDGALVQGENYGQRIRGYVDEAVDLLVADPHSRRAWVPIWQSYDLMSVALGAQGNHHQTRYPSRESSNIPCTLGFALNLENDILGMQTVMRSQSVVGVMPYDIFLLTSLQELIANELADRRQAPVFLGPYQHVMLSCHVYERDVRKARAIIEWNEGTHGATEPMEPCHKSLSEARETWPSMMASIAGNEEAADEYFDHPEEVIRMLAKFAKGKIRDEAVANASS